MSRGDAEPAHGRELDVTACVQDIHLEADISRQAKVSGKIKFWLVLVPSIQQKGETGLTRAQARVLIDKLNRGGVGRSKEVSSMIRMAGKWLFQVEGGTWVLGRESQVR